MREVRLIPLLLFSASLALWPALAHANPFELYGAGGQGAATAGAQTAVADGPSALFYNVGGLVDSPDTLTAGIIAGVNRTSILLDERPAGYDVPTLGGHSPAVPSEATPTPRSDTTDIEPLYAFTLGAVTSLGLDDFRAGALLVIPAAGYIDVNTHFVDERERLFTNQLHFELIDRRVRRMDIELGAAYRLSDWLSAGLGASFVPGSAMNTQVFIPSVAAQDEAQINSHIDTESHWGLTAGVLARLWGDALRLGVNYRQAVYFRIHGTNHIRIKPESADDDRLIEQGIDWYPSYSPDLISAGLAWSIGPAQLMADVRWARWSDFRNTQAEPAGFDDTLSPRIGFGYTLSPRTELRAGAGWVPTPVGEQTGRTNYVDNDRLLGSAGAAYRFEALGQTFELDWALQLQVLLERHTVKASRQDYPDCADGVVALCDEVPDDTADPRTGQPYPGAQGLQTGNPGFPGFSSGGWLGAVTIELGWLPAEELE